MVRNDHIHAKLFGKGGFLHGGNTAVYRNYQPDALRGKLPQRNFIQAVALLQPPGYVGYAVRPVAAEKMGQQAGGGNAVHVIVAEYGDFFAPGHGKSHPPGGKAHIRQRKRFRQRPVNGQCRLCLPGILHSSRGQNHGRQRCVSALRQCVYAFPITRSNIPDTVFQDRSTSIIKLFILLYQKTDGCTIPNFAAKTGEALPYPPGPVRMDGTEVPPVTGRSEPARTPA